MLKRYKVWFVIKFVFFIFSYVFCYNCFQYFPTCISYWSAFDNVRFNENYFFVLFDILCWVEPSMCKYHLHYFHYVPISMTTSSNYFRNLNFLKSFGAASNNGMSRMSYDVVYSDTFFPIWVNPRHTLVNPSMFAKFGCISSLKSILSKTDIKPSIF